LAGADDAVWGAGSAGRGETGYAVCPFILGVWEDKCLGQDDVDHFGNGDELDAFNW